MMEECQTATAGRTMISDPGPRTSVEDRGRVSRPVDGAALKLDAPHLRIGTGGNLIHLLENGDLSVILARGQGKSGPGGAGIPCGADSVEGHVVIVLAVDGEHDEVHFSPGDHTRSATELLGEAIHVLETALQGAERVAQ